VRKALQLFWRCNPTLIEWIQSPLQYLTAGAFVGRARQLLPSVYSCEKGIYHYRSMAKTNYRGYLREEQVPHKKYFYVLRPLLAVRWIETHRTAPPIELQSLLGMLKDEPRLLDDIHALIETKRVSPEMGRAPPIASLHRFIEAELERLERLLPDKAPRAASMDDLNALFHATLAELQD
jgi:predicted nucleotidyltransferase